MASFGYVYNDLWNIYNYEYIVNIYPLKHIYSQIEQMHISVLAIYNIDMCCKT